MWVDKKLDLILGWLREGRFTEDIDDLVEDLRICHDQAREFFDIYEEMEKPEDLELYRTRCNKILVAIGVIKKHDNTPRHREYLEALEGVLLGVLSKKG